MNKFCMMYVIAILLMSFSTVCSGYWQSDFNRDGVVDFGDLSLFASQWLMEDSPQDNLKYEFNFGNAAIECRRLSNAYEQSSDFFDSGEKMPHVGPDTVRTRKVTVFGAVEPTIQTVKRMILAVDETNGLILYKHGSYILQTSTADNLDALTTIVDADDDFGGEHVSVNNPMREFARQKNPIQSVCAVGGVWIICLGNYGGPSDPVSSGVDLGRWYRSDDMGKTWTLVHSSKYGFASFHGWHVDGNRATCGDYNVINLSGGNGGYGHNYWFENGRNAYLTEDKGLTWTTIPDINSYGEPFSQPGVGQAGRHIHGVIMNPDDEDELFVAFGDGRGVMLRRLVRTEGDWSCVQELDAYTQYGGGGNVYDGILYIGRSGTNGIITSIVGSVLSFDPEDDYARKVQFDVAKVLTEDCLGADSTRSGPYRYHFAAKDCCRNVIRHKGVWYTSIYHYNTGVIPVEANDGLYASVDGRNWTAVYRNPATHYVMRVSGVIGDKLILELSDNKSLLHSGTIPTVKAESVQAIVCEKGMTNRFYPMVETMTSCENGSIEDVKWELSSKTQGNGVLSIADGEGLFGDRALKFQALASGDSNFESREYMSSISDQEGNNLRPQQGDLMTFSVWMRGARGCPKNWKVRFNANSTAGRAGVQYDYCIVTENWRKIVLTGYQYGEELLNKKIRLFIDNSGVEMPEEDIAASVIYFDGFSITYDKDRWRGVSASFVPTGESSNYGRLDDDWSEINIEGIEGDWTVSFDWMPTEGLANFPDFNARHGTVAVAQGDNLVKLFGNTIFGDAHFSNFSTTVELSAAVAVPAMVGKSMNVGDRAYMISSVTDSTHIELEQPYVGATSNPVDSYNVVLSIFFPSMAGEIITIGGVEYTVESYISPEMLTISPNYSGAEGLETGLPYCIEFDRLPVMSIQGDDGYIDLLWNQETRRFDITDGLHREETSAIRWLQHDMLKFALVHNGSETNLYWFAPEGGFGKVVGSGGVTLNVPESIKLGTNSNEDNVGCGCFANVRVWNAAIPDTEVFSQCFQE